MNASHPPHRPQVEDLKGGDAQLNAAILRDVFAGQKGEADSSGVTCCVRVKIRNEARPDGVCVCTMCSYFGVGPLLVDCCCDDALALPLASRLRTQQGGT